MDLDQFLEKDIIRFLDGKSEKISKSVLDREEEYGLYLTKDYLKELDAALDKDELTKAKKLFEELKDKYNKMPVGSIERKKIYSILDQMYTKIKNYVELREKQSFFFGKPTTAIQQEIKKSFSSSKVDSLLDELDKPPAEDLVNAELDKKNQKKKEEDYEHQKEEEQKIKEEKKKLLLEQKTHNKKELENKLLSLVDEIKKLLDENYIYDAKRKLFSLRDLFEEYKQMFSEESYSTGEDERSSIESEILSLERRLSVIERAVARLKGISYKAAQNKKSEEHKKLQEALKQKQQEDTSKKETYKEDITKKLEEEIRREKERRKKIEEEERKKHQQKLKEFLESNPNAHNSIEELYEEGIYNMFQNNYKDALQIFEKILEIKPNNKAARIRFRECRDIIDSA